MPAKLDWEDSGLDKFSIVDPFLRTYTPKYFAFSSLNLRNPMYWLYPGAKSAIVACRLGASLLALTNAFLQPLRPETI